MTQSPRRQSCPACHRRRSEQAWWIVGVPAKPIRERFDRIMAKRYQALAWLDWDRARLRAAPDDFRALEVEEFLEKHGG